MKILDYFKKKKKSAAIAKERLQIIISHERGQQKDPDFLPKLQQEILDVIAKYVHINKEKVKVQLEHSGDHAILELNIPMPEKPYGEPITGPAK